MSVECKLRLSLYARVQPRAAALTVQQRDMVEQVEAAIQQYLEGRHTGLLAEVRSFLLLTDTLNVQLIVD